MEAKFDEAKGRAKEAAGALADDEELKGEGKLDQLGAEIKELAEKTQQKVEDVVDALKERLR